MILLFYHHTLPKHDRLVEAIRERPALRDMRAIQVELPILPEAQLVKEVKAALQRYPADMYYTYTAVSFRALKSANTERKPVVFISVQDLRETGVVDEAGNRLPDLEHVAGLSIFAASHPKSIEVIRDAFPRTRRLGVLVDETFDPSPVVRAMEQFPDLEPVYVGARRFEPVADVHARIREARADAWYFPQTAYLQDNYKELVPHLRADRVRGLYGWNYVARGGGTLALQAAIPDRDQRTAEQIELILTGTPPAQIAIETASVLRLFGNKEALRELGAGFDARMLRYIDTFY